MPSSDELMDVEFILRYFLILSLVVGGVNNHFSFLFLAQSFFVDEESYISSPGDLLELMTHNITLFDTAGKGGILASILLATPVEYNLQLCFRLLIESVDRE